MVGGTWWPILPPGLGLGYGPQGQGATYDVTYNPEDPPKVYSNPTIHSRLSEYSSMAREVHGPEFDPSTQPIDGEIIMRVGGGKKHGRYWIADSTLDTAKTQCLPCAFARAHGNRLPCASALAHNKV